MISPSHFFFLVKLHSIPGIPERRRTTCSIHNAHGFAWNIFIFKVMYGVWYSQYVHGYGWMEITDRYPFLFYCILCNPFLITSFTTYFTTCVYIPWHMKSYMAEKTISSHSQQHCNKKTSHFLLMFLFTKFGTAPLLLPLLHELPDF